MRFKEIKTVVVTGGAGQIAYNLLFRLAAGDLFGPNTSIRLCILETKEAVESLKGVVMELEDCAFPLLQDIVFGTNPLEIFLNADCVFLIGAKPRGLGMERKELLLDNAAIFAEQGKALDAVAKKDVVVLVIGNPCNTNCLIAKSFAKRIRSDHFFSMTRLDQNRARAFLAKKANVFLGEVSHVTIWGNHSSTQVPDFIHAKISGRPALEVLRTQESWLKTEFIGGAEEGRKNHSSQGESSAGSAAQAALDAMRSLLFPSKQGEWFSMGVSSDSNPYGISSGLIFSFPCQRTVLGKIQIVKGLQIDPYLEGKIRSSETELLQEKQMIEHLLNKGDM